MKDIIFAFIVIFGLCSGVRMAYYRDYIRRYPNSKLALKAEAKEWVKEVKKFTSRD